MNHAMKPLRMPYAGRDVPHAVIEVNQRCNISCAACYKDKSTYTKPLAQVLDEIALVTSVRNIGVLSLAGGEPTLHPDLPAIIASIARRGIQVQLLTNGLNLTDEKLATYKAHGLARVYLHIDSLQRRPDARRVERESDLTVLREQIAERVVRWGMRCALTVTLYRTKNLQDLPALVEQVLDSRFIDRLLVTCCTDFAAIDARLRELQWLPASVAEPPGDLSGEVVSNDDVTRALTRFGMKPFAYVASDRNLDDMRWLFYYSFTARTPAAALRLLHLGPSFGRVARAANALSKRLRGRFPFGETLGRGGALLTCLAYAATSGDLGEVGETLSFLRAARRRDAQLTQKSFIFQQGPSVTAAGEIEICKDCPDATVRNGRVIPVCLADLLSPQAPQGA